MVYLFLLTYILFSNRMIKFILILIKINLFIYLNNLPLLSTLTFLVIIKNTTIIVIVKSPSLPPIAAPHYCPPLLLLIAARYRCSQSLLPFPFHVAPLFVVVVVAMLTMISSTLLTK